MTPQVKKQHFPLEVPIKKYVSSNEKRHSFGSSQGDGLYKPGPFPISKLQRPNHSHLRPHDAKLPESMLRHHENVIRLHQSNERYRSDKDKPKMTYERYRTNIARPPNWLEKFRENDLRQQQFKYWQKDSKLQEQKYKQLPSKHIMGNILNKMKPPPRKYKPNLYEEHYNTMIYPEHDTKRKPFVFPHGDPKSNQSFIGPKIAHIKNSYDTRKYGTNFRNSIPKNEQYGRHDNSKTYKIPPFFKHDLTHTKTEKNTRYPGGLQTINSYQNPYDFKSHYEQKSKIPVKTPQIWAQPPLREDSSSQYDAQTGTEIKTETQTEAAYAADHYSISPR